MTTQQDRNFKALIQESKDRLKLKWWIFGLVLAVIILTLTNVAFFASNRHFRQTHIESLQVINRAYQDLLGAYDEQSENCDYYLEKLREQQLEK